MVFRKPLIEWREPDEVVRARRAHSKSPRRLIVWSLLLIVAGAGFVIYAAVRAPGQDAPLSLLVGEVFAAIGVWMLAVWMRQRAAKRFRLYRRRSAARAVAQELPGAVAIVKHPLCPLYRALLIIGRDSSRSFVGMPHEVSDSDIRRVWSQSEWGDLPLQSSDRSILKPRKEKLPGDSFFDRHEGWPDPKTGHFEGRAGREAPDEERNSAPGKTILQWPDAPRYWPTVFEHRNALVRLASWFLFVSPLINASMRVIFDAFDAHTASHYSNEPIWLIIKPSVYLTGILVAVVAAVWAAGAFFGWNDNVVRMAENELIFFGLLRRKAFFRWESVKEVAIHLSPYSDKAEEIEVVYDYYGIEATFAMKLRSKRIEDERLAKALAEKMGSEQEVTQGPDGVTIRVRAARPMPATASVKGDKSEGISASGF